MPAFGTDRFFGQRVYPSDQFRPGDRLRFMPKELSCSQHRAATVRALELARLLPANEPTAAPDSAMGCKVMELLRDAVRSFFGFPARCH